MADGLSILNFSQTQFLLNVPEFFGNQATVQSVTSGTWTSLSLDNGVIDNWSGHSNSTNNSRYTAQVAGVYTVSGCYAPVSNATGYRAARITKNGTPVMGGAGSEGPAPSFETGVLTPVIAISMAVGDYVEVQGFQNSGGALNTILDVDLRCSLTVRFSSY